LPSIAGAAMLRFASSAMANSAALPHRKKKRFAEPGIDDRRIKNQLDLSMRK
jgi:hypothetical protein